MADVLVFDNSGIFVVDLAQTYLSGGRCSAILGYENLLSSSSITGAAADAAYPFSLAYDNKSNTEYSPAATSGSVVINFYKTASWINYVALFSKNAGDCGLSFVVEVLNDATGIYESVGSRSGISNASPQMVYFDPLTSSAQRITITFTSKCYIASIAIGKAIEFGKTPSVGYQPGRNSSLDEASGFSTDGNNFVQGRRITNGFEEVAPFSYLKYNTIDVWWKGFMNHVLDSKPLYFMANSQQQENVIYGMQDPARLTKPKFKNSIHTEMELAIRGWA